MSPCASYSIVLDRPADMVWSVVRDFNSYPLWLDGVDESYVEDGLPGTAVGAIRSFAIGGVRRRQRLIAHSDVERFFTYEGSEPLTTMVDDIERTMDHYQATVRLLVINEGDRCFAQWSSSYCCPALDDEYWAGWWRDMLPAWLASLRDHLAKG